MDCRHKSGAQKRKEKSAKEVESARGQTSLNRWGFTSKAQAQEENELCVGGDSTSAEHSSHGACGVEDVASNQREELAVQPDNNNVMLASGHGDKQCTADVQADNSTPLRTGKTTKLHDVDIGVYAEDEIAPHQIEEIIRRGHETIPKGLPKDAHGHDFIHSLLTLKLKNGQAIHRDWLVWSRSRKTLYCLPCRLFSNLPESSRSSLASPSGYSSELAWGRLYDKLPEHESSKDHKNNYITWRDEQRRIEKGETVVDLLDDSIRSEVALWRQILRRLVDVTLFLAERGRAFRGESSRVGDVSNGNFLGLLVLIAHYDPVLEVHLQKVKESQEAGRRLQVHYLSPEIQNEFISCCAKEVLRYILEEREKSKYFSIVVDATPDSAHIEQTVFVLRYLICRNEEREDKYVPVERLLAFVDCNQKTGEAIADLIVSTLKKHHINLKDCRGQGYDNGSNMSGPYKGAQARIIQENPLALFSPCACHSLNLVGVHSVQCCTRAVTFFGVVQNLYNICSGIPQQWEILLKETGASLHSLSETRWSQRADAVKPFASHLPGLLKVVDEIKLLNLSAETRATLNGVSNYLKTFECVLMASIWFKVLTAINQRSTVLQARDATLDVEVANIESLLEEMKALRSNGWLHILNEYQLVYESMNPPQASPDADSPASNSAIPEKRRRKAKAFPGEPVTVDAMASRSFDERFEIDTFYVILDAVISNLSTRYDHAYDILKLYQFLWKYTEMGEEQLRECVDKFQGKYHDDVGPELFDEIIHLKAIHAANLGPKQLAPLKLRNQIHYLCLEVLFPNVCVALQLFCTLPVTVAGGERLFSTLSRVKNVLRSTMCQSRLTDLPT